MKHNNSTDFHYIKDAILKMLRKRGKSLNIKQIAWGIGLKKGESQKIIQTAISQLIQEGFIKKQNNYKFISTPLKGAIIGIIDINKSGNGYVRTESYSEDIFIREKNRLNSLNKDTVSVKLIANKKIKKEGIIIEVLERANTKFMGVINDDGKNAFFISDNDKIGSDFFIPRENLKNAKNNSRVIIEFVDWPLGAGCPFGNVIRVINSKNSLKTAINSNIELFNIRHDFSAQIQAELQKKSNKISKNDLGERKDFRNVNTFTIDPLDAKDFDDAISVEFLNKNNIKIGVHIADVSHYIKSGSEIDKEAALRAFSVYFPGKVVPMLPEKLSNEICSLRPNEDKLCMSVVFEFDDLYNLQSVWMGEGIINSNHRFTYQQAEKIILKEDGDYVSELIALDQIAQSLRAKRIEDGSIEFERTDLRFVLDEGGEPIKIIKKTTLKAHKLVEEFMLLANKIVAEKLSKLKLSIYRIHDQPDLQKLKELSIYLQHCYSTKKLPVFSKKNIATYINSLLNLKFKNTYSSSIENLVLRSMAKAKYSSENIGHFGLGFEQYTHFTSPIRRYADLLVHRMLKQHLNKSQIDFVDLEKKCTYFSSMEKTYVDVERRINKFIQLKLLQNYIGDCFPGFISSVKKWGIYVDLEDGKGEGLVLAKNLYGDNYYYDERLHTYVGQKSKTKYSLGQSVVVEIESINLFTLEMDLVIK